MELTRSTLKLFPLFLLLPLVFLSCGTKKDDSTTAKEMEDRAALRAAYSQFVGVYTGPVTPLASGARPIPVEIQINLVEVPDGVNENREVIFRPELQGYFIRTDYAGLNPWARRPLTMRYYRDSTEIAMANSDKITSPIPDNGKVQISAFIRGGNIDGDISFVIGDPVTGKLHLRKN